MQFRRDRGRLGWPFVVGLHLSSNCKRKKKREKRERDRKREQNKMKNEERGNDKGDVAPSHGICPRKVKQLYKRGGRR